MSSNRRRNKVNVCAVRRSGRERQTIYNSLDEDAMLSKMGVDRRQLQSIVSQANDALENRRSGRVGASSSHVYPTRSKEHGTAAYQLDREDLAVFGDRNEVDEEDVEDEDDDDEEEEEEDEADDDGSHGGRKRVKALSVKAMSRRSARLNGCSSSSRRDSDCNETMYERVKTRQRNSRLVTPSPDTEEPTPTRKTRSMRPLVIVPDADESNQSYTDVKREHKSDDKSSDEDDDDDDDDVPKQYHLRQHRNPVARFEIRLPEPRHRHAPVESTRTLRSRHIESVAFRSPAHKSGRKPVRKHLERRSSSTSSCASEVDRDDEKFERRKLKSLNRARRRFLPMNIESGDLRNGIIKDRMRAQTGASCSDIDPMAIDRSIGFDKIGGLSHHLQSLKEMVLFPLLYHDIFDKFNMAPPRGVIFYGPPGTGKTLVARALANECSRGDKKVSFFMRRGADVLSKWVGESERQLRLLFDQAYTMRPSIIFFDEIDGLAPVRSSRQDQIHSSIVSTLLALMDGLDGRGEVIIIGATNRLDSLDPALRRPGRFDRELKFSLPDRTARRSILSIHTSSWGDDSRLSADVLDWLTEQTSGYCGADLKELCTEAVLIALRREYPQIYLSNDKYKLDVNAVRVQRIDFVDSIRKIVPASRRDMRIVSRPLSQRTRPLLISLIENIMKERIPPGYVIGSTPHESTRQQSELSEVMSSLKRSPVVPAARLLLCGRNSDYGQTSHLAPALIHAMDHLTVFSLSISNIYAASSHRSPEEAVAEMLQSATRSATAHSPLSGGPCIVFIPAIDIWLSVVPSSVWHTLVSAVESWDGYTSIFLLATSHRVYDNSPSEIRSLFHRSQSIEIGLPSDAERFVYFEQMLLKETCIEPIREPVLLQLPLAPAEPIRKLNEWESSELKKQENSLLREMRIFLREMLGRLIRDRRFNIFAKPVNPEDAPDYFDIIAQPMDLSTMMDKIDQHRYDSVTAFLDDIALIVRNALEYNPNRELTDKLIRHRASALKDSADALIDAELDWDFEKRLQELRKLRNPPNANAVAIEPPAHALRNMSPMSSNSLNSYPASLINTVKTTKLSANRKRRGRASYRRSKRRRVCIVGQRTSAAIVKKYRRHKRTTTATRTTTASVETIDEEEQIEGDDETPPPTTTIEHDETDSHDSAKLPTTPTPPESLLIDRAELTRLIDDVVRKTNGWSIGALERLASKLHVVIDTFSNRWDRMTMPMQLRDVIDNFSLTN